MASTVSESGGVKVITQVLQATDPRAAQLMPCPSPTTSYPGSILVKDFRKAQPKALGLTVSGSLLVETEKRDSASMVQACCIISTLVIVASLVAAIIYGVEISQNVPWCPVRGNVSGNKRWCQSPTLTGPNHGVNTVFILLCLLEMSTAIAALVYGCKAIRGENYTRMVL
ncbi:membrane-spanning 4-domains subfamily A member 8 isoform X2 [Alligator mississippiensis]|uniref:membrane-spanning 4-domains subfamily A member 8 isoform X2 n=1 Tax=Alligator mississippiensis TaxID=8496 RepID=UPI000907054C|nr:membrane-spanning 4-domains subfamily A member 8 isoform X2 [Alligator mississippiensis]